MRFTAGVVLALAGLASAGIYPDGHFDVSTKLTVDTYKDVIQSTIDAGKTLMAPGWNEVVQLYASNGDVAFADVNLSEEKIKEGADGTPFAPGAGGWPTIRYFNAETGVGGAPYKKKTDKAMCEELKDIDYMSAYVDEAAKTSLCSVGTGAGCSAKQADYAAKWKDRASADVDAETARLGKMLVDDAKLKPDAKKWLRERLAVLKQLPVAPPAEVSDDGAGAGGDSPSGAEEL